MAMTLYQIAKKLKCSENTVRIYLSRAEFAHIEICKENYVTVYKGLKKWDFIRLEKLINRKRATDMEIR